MKESQAKGTVGKPESIPAVVRLAIAASLCCALLTPAAAESLDAALPAITSKDYHGVTTELGTGALFGFERELRNEFRLKNAPDEVFALATNDVEDFLCCPNHQPGELVVFSIYGKRGLLKWFVNGTRAYWFERPLSPEEVAIIRQFILTSRVDDLASFSDSDVVGGIVQEYLHLTDKSGCRVMMFNPPESPPSKESAKRFPRGSVAWKYAALVEFFEKFKNPEKVALRYALTPPISQPRVVFAHPTLEIRGVWKQGGQLCVAIRRYGCGSTEYRILADGRLGATVDNPRLLEDTGDRCTSPDGRWVLQIDNGELKCRDDRNKKDVNIFRREELAGYYPLHYVQAHQAFLLAQFRIQAVPQMLVPLRYRMFDPITGKSTPFHPEQLDVNCNGYDKESDPKKLEPWFQTLPRRLQAVRGKPDAVWAASSTSYCDPVSRVGCYDARTFRWLGGQLIPYFQLQTKHIWVDEDHRQIYAICDGHLLLFDLKQEASR